MPLTRKLASKSLIKQNTNQAGSVRFSHGSELVTCLQTRQEIVVWSDSALYSLQYVGPPAVWQSQLLGDNISIASQNAAATASGLAKTGLAAAAPMLMEEPEAPPPIASDKDMGQRYRCWW